MGEHTRPLSAFDAQFLAGEAGNMLSHYCGVWIAAPDASGRPLSLERVRKVVESRIDRIPALRWRLKSVPLNLDHPSFVDGPIDLDHHILGRTLDDGQDPRALSEAIADIMATKLDRRRPLWEFHVIDGLPDDRVAVAMKFHHAAADALSATMLILSLVDFTPEGPDSLPDVVEPQPAPSTRDVVYRAATGAPRQPLRAVRATLSAMPHLDQVPSMRVIPGANLVARAARTAQRLVGGDPPAPQDHSAPRMRFNAPLSPRRSIAFGGVPVDVVRELKTAHGATFNDVVLAAVAGGMRRRLTVGDELPADPLLAFVPSNIRTENAGRIENAISSFVVPIPTNLDDAGERVRAAHQAMRAAKDRHSRTPVTLLEDANAMVLPVAFAPLAAGMLRLMGSRFVTPPINLTMSNVPGPPEQLYLDGAPLETVSPFSLIFDGVALNVTVISYAGRLEIGVVGDAEAVPDAWELVADIEAEFASMHESAVSRM